VKPRTTAREKQGTWLLFVVGVAFCTAQQPPIRRSAGGQPGHVNEKSPAL
jgi:hypothetical protein